MLNPDPTEDVDVETDDKTVVPEIEDEDDIITDDDDDADFEDDDDDDDDDVEWTEDSEEKTDSD